MTDQTPVTPVEAAIEVLHQARKEMAVRGRCIGAFWGPDGSVCMSGAMELAAVGSEAQKLAERALYRVAADITDVYSVAHLNDSYYSDLLDDDIEEILQDYDAAIGYLESGVVT